MARRIEMDILREAANAIAACGHKEKGKVAARYAEMIGKSVPTLYRTLKREGLYVSQRKRRADAGAVRVDVSEEQMLKTMAMRMTSKRNTGAVEMPAEVAIEIAEEAGVIPKGALSASTLNRHLRRMQADERALLAATPHINMQSLHPNHVHQVDPSVCLQWDIDDKGANERDMLREYYKNKPQNVAKITGKRTKKLLRYVLTDHFSGHIEVKYYFIAGESAVALVDFLVHCWFPKQSGNPFQGASDILLWDEGSANTSHPVKSLCDAVGVEILTHLPGNPRGKGQVECANRIVQRNFESRMRISPPKSLDELNRLAAAWCLYYNSGKVHSRTQHTRDSVWQTIKPEHLRTFAATPDEVRMLAQLKPMTRKIRGDYTITIASRGNQLTYRLSEIPGMAPRSTVQVRRNAFTPDTIQVRICDDDAWIEVQPLQYASGKAGGFEIGAPIIGESHASLPDTLAMQRERAMTLDAYNVDTDREATNARKRREKPFAGIDAMAPITNYEAPTYMPRTSTELDIPTTAAPEIKPMSLFKAMQIIANRHGRLSADQHADLARAYPDGMTQDQIDDWITAQSEPSQKPALRAVS